MKTANRNSACPSKTITQLAWKPMGEGENMDERELKLAVASEDCSLRVLSLQSFLKASP